MWEGQGEEDGGYDKARERREYRKGKQGTLARVRVLVGASFFELVGRPASRPRSTGYTPATGRN